MYLLTALLVVVDFTFCFVWLFEFVVCICLANLCFDLWGGFGWLGGCLACVIVVFGLCVLLFMWLVFAV